MGDIINTVVEDYVQNFFGVVFRLPASLITEIRLTGFDCSVKVKTVFPFWDKLVGKTLKTSTKFKLIVELPAQFRKIDEKNYFVLMESLSKRLPKIYQESINSWSVDCVSKKEAEKMHTIAVDIFLKF